MNTQSGSLSHFNDYGLTTAAAGRMVRAGALPWLLLIGLALSGAVQAQGVVVDEFSTSHIFNAIGPAPVTTTGFASDAATILGTERDVEVQILVGGGGEQTTSNAGSSGLGHGETNNARGQSRITWDGIDADAAGAVLDGNNNVSGGGIDLTGLGGLDLQGNCGSPAPGLYFLAGPSDNGNNYDVTVNVYTDTDEWSSLTRTKTGTNPLEVLEYAFADFSDQGNSGTSGADFTNVNAIELIIEVTGLGTDLNIKSPIFACEVDLGDAPDDSVSAPFGTTYETLLFEFQFVFPPANVRAGPSHAISGPWMPDISNAIGLPGANDTDGEDDGQPNATATGDDADADPGDTPDDEQGVTLANFADFQAGGPPFQAVQCDGQAVGNSYYCAAVRVANPLDEAAQLVGWVDFNGDGFFGSDCDTTDGTVKQPGGASGRDCERSAAQVMIGTTGLANFGGTCSAASSAGGTLVGSVDFSAGNIPGNCEGIVIVRWDLGDDTEVTTVTTDETFSRFRITSDTGRGFFGSGPALPGSPTEPVHYGLQSSGEVEDHRVPAGFVPVSIHAFESLSIRSGLQVSWSTVSENENIGFYLWGDTGRSLELLTPNMIASQSTDVMATTAYSVVVPNQLARSVRQLMITAVDIHGNEELFGLFEPGKAYGREAVARPIDWSALEAAVAARLSARGFEQKDRVWRAPASGAISAVDFRVDQTGMQRIGYQDLLDAGLDLAGVDPAEIAVTVDGRPVARRIHRFDDGGLQPLRSGNAARGGSFGSSHVIDFWGELPDFPDAMYVDAYNYRISVDPASVVDVERHAGERLLGTATVHWVRSELAEDNHYAMGSPLSDPWYMKLLRADHATGSFQASLAVDARARVDQGASLEVVLAGVTDFPEAPDHRVELWVNGQQVDSIDFDGRMVKHLVSDLAPGVFQTGANQVEVRLPGGTGVPADLVYLDSLALVYAVPIEVANDRVLIDDVAPDHGLQVARVSAGEHLAYSFDGQRLVQLPVRSTRAGVLEVTPPRGAGLQHWVSAADALHRPQAVGGVGEPALFSASSDFLIIAHPAFLPATPWDNHPLNEFVARRSAEGWRVGLFDLAAIQQHYSNGMPLPQAITRFLQDAETRFGFEHVLLVGSDSYDYQDRLGLGSISFLPTRYAATRYVRHTPSDALLADLDGDGLGDKAIGRWPVRSLDDLASIVTKTFDWQDNMAAGRSAVWAADVDDPSLPAFSSQAARLIQPLVEQGWPESELNTVLMGGDHFASAAEARAEFFALLEQGRTLTGFSGHGSAGMWTNQGFLVPEDISALHNEGQPTLIGTQACYSSYFVSPHNDTVAHRWMNGYRTDAQGSPIAGATNGAVAVHSASTLSNYLQNEAYSRWVIEHQVSGHTLGQAVQLARQQANQQGMADLVVNWVLLGDPTLRLAGTEQQAITTKRTR